MVHLTFVLYTQEVFKLNSIGFISLFIFFFFHNYGIKIEKCFFME